MNWKILTFILKLTFLIISGYPIVILVAGLFLFQSEDVKMVLQKSISI